MKKRIDRESFYLQEYSIDECNAFVLKKQFNIYEGAIKGKMTWVKTNQKYLIKSKEACYLAVRRVITNNGGKTPGIDGYIPTNRSEYRELINKLSTLKPANYKASPLKRVWIPKTFPSKDLRPLSIPTIFDRCLQALWAFALDPYNEALSDEHNMGFRKGRSCSDAKAYLQPQLARPGASDFILEVDIKKCFDTIDHNYIMNNIPVNRNILHEWLKSGIMDSKQFYYDAASVPQGGIISPIICNLVLNGFEKHIKEQLTIWRKNNLITLEETRFFVFCRYADDMVIIGKTINVLDLTKIELKKFLEIRGLKINQKKTKLTHISDGFKFVGFFFKRYKPKKQRFIISKANKSRKEMLYEDKGKLLVTPPDKNIKRVISNLKDKISTCSTQEALYFNLNPIIVGFSNFYRIATWSMAQRKLAHALYNMLIKWYRNRYKTSKKDAYLTLYEDYKTVKLIPENQRTIKRYKELRLHTFSAYSKVSLNQITSTLTPYNRYDRTKFYGHLEAKTLKLATGKKTEQLFKKTKCHCALCSKNLVEDNQDNYYEVHHITPLEYDGDNDIRNLTLLCKSCHTYVTGVQRSKSLNEMNILISKNICKIPTPYLDTYTVTTFSKETDTEEISVI